MNIKQSFRIIFRNKTYSILNILGLTVGITSAALIFLWVEYKMSFNRAIPNVENIYMIGQNQRYGDEINTFFVASSPMSRTLNESFPEIKCNTRSGGEGSQTFILEKENKSFTEYGRYMDATTFDMIGMKFIRGDARTAFNPAFPIVISEKMSEKIFGKDDPVGKTLRVEDRLYEVTGIFEDLPGNTSFQFEWLIPFRILENDCIERGWISVDHWGSNWHSCYVEVQSSTDIQAINQKLKGLISEKTDGKNDTELFIYPITKMSLYWEFKDGKATGGGYIRTVRLFFIIGLVIVFIACINFMNLSTARSQKRALEVGVRKTFGAKRTKLVHLFLNESGIMTVLSLVLAVGLIYFCLPSFNQLVSLKLSLDFTNPVHVCGLLGVALICTFLAGAYPAFYLSSFSPMNTLKKQKISTGSAAWVRKGLVIFQFAVAFILICTTTVIYQQIQYAQKRDMGIKKENLVTFGVTPGFINNYDAIQNELRGTGFAESAALSSQTLLQIWSNGGSYKWAGKNLNTNPLISIVQASPNLIHAAGLNLVSGSDFLPQDSMGSMRIIINQTLADMMGEEGRIGGKIGQSDDPTQHHEIKGIVEDFVFNDAYRGKSDPVIFFPTYSSANFLFVRLKPDVNQIEALAKIKSVLQQFSPDKSFEPTFMDDRFNRMFSGDRLEGKLAALFAGLAIFISCLGLFGLSAFSAEQRTKEIGIRKVLGASIKDILVLLGKGYMVLIIVALAIGIPVAWYIAGNYLRDYSYKISLSWALFTGVALLVVLIAILTVSFQSLKAAVNNPVKSIKTE
ncbi:MAG: ABC transporter permease [Dysgonamonadaceae bacterium]|jgi:ABC-type antimicrobial peptide transport system permease subunit|nr:ABC transporter permease [Dysgonamonadaceae bacterium]